MKRNYRKPACRNLSAVSKEVFMLSSVHTSGNETGGTGGGRQGVSISPSNRGMWDL